MSRSMHGEPKLVGNPHDATCRIPDDCIDSRRYPLFMAREVMRGLIEQINAQVPGQRDTSSC